MATVKVKGLDQLENKVKKTFKDILDAKAMRTEIGEFLVERIQLEARRGRPLNDTRSLPDLKDSTKRIRQELSKLNPTHPSYQAGRSNVTFTGQLVDALAFRLRADRVIVIRVAKTLRRILQGAISKPKSGIPPNNRQVDRDLRDRGFFMFTVKGVDSEPKIRARINNIVKKYVRRAIKVNFGS